MHIINSIASTCTSLSSDLYYLLHGNSHNIQKKYWAGLWGARSCALKSLTETLKLTYYLCMQTLVHFFSF